MAKWLKGASFSNVTHLVQPIVKSVDKLTEAASQLETYYTPQKKLTYSERLEELKRNDKVDRI